MKLKLSGKGKKAATVAGPSPGYFPNGNQGEISTRKFAIEDEVVFDRLIFSGGKRIKVTDFIWHAGVGGTGYTLSERTKTTLEQFNLPEHRFYKLPVYEDNKGENHQYYKLHMLIYPFDYSFIDFELSTFYFGDIFKREKEIVSYTNGEELRNKIKNLDRKEKIWSHQIYLNNEYEKSNLDCFYIHHLTNEFAVTKRLKEALENIKVTGIEFEKSEIEFKK